MKSLLAVAPLALAICLSTPVSAQGSVEKTLPTATPLPAPIPEARDVAYPGTVLLNIDATDTVHGIYRVEQTFPVAPGTSDLIVMQPSWLPGNHSPTGPFALLADIRFFANGKPIAWERDPVAVGAFHLALPAGTTSVTAKFLHTSPVEGSDGRITMTQEMLNLQWEKMSLYPAGHYVRQINIKPSVTFPAGWSVFTALDGMKQTGSTVTWATTNYETLVDSPIFAGKYAKRWDLGHKVALNVVADKPGDLAITDSNLATYRKLSDEALALFGAQHFDHYDFLLALTDRMGGIGLEHQRSSENQYEPKALVDWDKMAWDRNVISHEFVHSWNGKYRRGADLWTPDYQTPMRDTLLWVYEGQTQFWGYVLAARSGIQPKEQVLGAFASYAGNFAEGEPGRAWRSVEDTTHAPIINRRRPLPYPSLTRNEDYYTEGALVWLEADQIIRKGTDGAKGLDDFAKAFFGMNDGDWGQLTYDFDEVVATLNSIYPYDWTSFLRTRLYTPGQPAPLNGINMGGYELAWKAEPNPYQKGVNEYRKRADFTYSLGFTLDKDGKVVATLWDGPAYNAGIVDGMTIVAVNGTAYDKDGLSDAVTAAKDAKDPIVLLVKRGDQISSVEIAYHGGLRYPWLVPVADGEQPLDRLLAPLTGTTAE